MNLGRCPLSIFCSRGTPPVDPAAVAATAMPVFDSCESGSLMAWQVDCLKWPTRHKWPTLVVHLRRNHKCPCTFNFHAPNPAPQAQNSQPSCSHRVFFAENVTIYLVETLIGSLCTEHLLITIMKKSTCVLACVRSHDYMSACFTASEHPATYTLTHLVS